MKLKHLSLSVMLIGAVSTVHASGYHFGTQSVSSQSTANASAAEASDASTIFYNAAGMTKLQGTNFSGALNLVAPSVKYSNAEAFAPPSLLNPKGQKVQGSSSGKITDDVIAVPHLYLTHQLNDKVTAGLGIYVPFASKTDYQRDSVLRYNLNATELTTIDINPTIAFKLNEQHSVAVGVIAQHAAAKLRQYANFGTAVPGQSGTGKYDGFAEVDGDDWGFGFNLAWLWDINDQATVGLNYRSKINHTLEGDADWTTPSAGLGIPGVLPIPPVNSPGSLYQGYVDSSASIKISTPESLSLHGMYKFTPKWNGYADITWTKHSRFDIANLIYGVTKSAGATRPGVSAPVVSNTTILTPNWKNTYKVSLGASYQYSEPLQLRGGIAYDESPVRSEDFRLATMPDNDRIWFSFGANYKLNKQSSIDAAYSYIKIKNGSANVNGNCGGSDMTAAGSLTPGLTQCVSSYVKGSADYKAYANLLGVQYNYRF